MATTPTLSSPGIGSGLDVNAIVQKLMSVEQQPLQQLNKQEAADQAKITAYGTVKSALSGLQTTLQALSTANNFQTLNASTSDATVVTATVSGKPVPASYTITVGQLAQAQKVASNGFANTSDAVGTGTLSFDFGTFDGTTFTSAGNGLKTVNIGADQSSLAGIRDAVNAANIGITATIINDGSATGNHLVFTANNSGAANSIKLTVVDGDGNNTDTTGLSQLAFDPAAGVGAGRNLTQQVAAQDALLTIDGLTVKSASNTVKDAIDGVTLNVLKQSPLTTTTVSVSTSTSNVDSAVAAFVKAYNDLGNTFVRLTKYDTTNKQASVLTGDSTVRTVQNQLRTLLGGQLGSGTYSTLSQVGVSFQADGTLSLDNAKLDSALASAPTAVTQLFAAMGSASDALVRVTGFTSKTVPGSYPLDVTQLATQGNLVGSGIAGLTITAGANDTLAVVLDGIAATVTLSPGTYADASALAAEVQSKINGTSAFSQAGSSVKVTQSGGIITMTSNRFGAASLVTATGSAAGAIFGSTPTATSGVDAAATLAGQALTGGGQTLLGPDGSAVEGLQMQIIGGALGARGTVTYQTGFAYRLNQLIGNVIDSDGSIAARTAGLQSEVTDIGKRRDALNARLAIVESNYRAQFNALDTLLSNLSAQSTALQQQLASLPKIPGTSSSS